MADEITTNETSTTEEKEDQTVRSRLIVSGQGQATTKIFLVKQKS